MSASPHPAAPSTPSAPIAAAAPAARVRCIPEDAGAILRVVFDGGKGNILDSALLRELTRTLRASPPTACALILEGNGANFSYGASVDEHRPALVGAFLKAFHELFRALAALPVPVFAAVRGQCLGGGLEIAAFCQRVFASPVARLGQPEIKLGVFAPIASLILPHRIGQPAADDLLLTGRTVNAQEALAMRLVDELAEDCVAAATRYARTHLVPLSRSSLRYAVQASRVRMYRDLLEDLGELEAIYLDALMKTPDAVEGIQAFLEKRVPCFNQGDR